MSAEDDGKAKKDLKKKKEKKRKRTEKESLERDEKPLKIEAPGPIVVETSQPTAGNSTTDHDRNRPTKKTKNSKNLSRKKRDGGGEDETLHDSGCKDGSGGAQESSKVQGISAHVSTQQVVASNEDRTEHGKKSSNKAAHKARREERKRLMSQLPTTDEHGIAYTKQQLRRMLKRLSRGLEPVESQEETKARLAQEAELKKQEEAELSGMLYEEQRAQAEDDKPEEMQLRSIVNDRGDGDTTAGTKAGRTKTVTPKRKREKALPSDYVCQACQNSRQPAHWIYDCPKKVTVRGTNQIAKKLKGIHNPLRKIFVSGLPFDVKQKDVQNLFQECGKILHCKLVKFEDTGRCRGQAYISFETEEAARKALSLNDTELTGEKNGGKNLKLKVTKALNRTVTKAKDTKEVAE